MSSPADLRHVAVFRLSTMSERRRALLHSNAPAIELILREVVLALDRCTGMHTLLLCTEDRAHWSVIAAGEFVRRAKDALRLSIGARPPNTAELLAAIGSVRLADVRLQFPALRERPCPTVPAPPRVWIVPHPYCFQSQLFHPSSCVAELRDELFASTQLATLADACRQNERPTAGLRAFAPTPAALHAWLTRAPYLFLFLAALGNAAVRRRWLDQRMVVGAPQMWNYLLHSLLLRAVDIYWPTDALAAHGIAGIPGLSCVPLPEPRLAMLHHDASPEAVTPVPAAAAVAHPMALGLDFPQQVRITADQPAVWIDSPMLAVAASRTYTGLPSQLVYNFTRQRWALVAECALERIIDDFSGEVLVVPVEQRRVCRNLEFYAADETLPADARVLCVRCWPVDVGAPIVDCNVPMVLVERAGYLSSPSQIASGRCPSEWWPLVAADLLLHPLRGAADSQLLWADGHWWRCCDPGPSVCLDPTPTRESLAAVLAFADAHALAGTPVPTAVFTCAPAAHAAHAFPVPQWYRCRLGCAKCPLSAPLARTGDSAVISRRELALVLWWHWHRFADYLLCVSRRAETLGRDWFAADCWLMKDALATGRTNMPAAAPLAQPKQAAAPVAGRHTSVQLRDSGQWEVNGSVARAAAETNGMQPLAAQIVYLLWLINDGSARNYKSWEYIGYLLYTLDSESTLYELAWRWWSRKYAESSYKESDWTGPRRKWTQLRSVRDLGNGQDLQLSMRKLAGIAKHAAGGRLHYSPDGILRALREFLQECREWFGCDPSAQ